MGDDENDDLEMDEAEWYTQQEEQQAYDGTLEESANPEEEQDDEEEEDEYDFDGDDGPPGHWQDTDSF